MMRAPQKGAPLAARSGNAMPPQEKQNAASRPIVPTLSAISTKPVSKVPLTPKVAGSAVSSASSPLNRRTAHQDSNTTPTLSQKDAFSTPLSSFLNTNVTPRSGSRKTRADSASSTPTHTPTGNSTPDMLRAANNGSSYGFGGLKINGIQSDTTKHSTVCFSPAVSEVGSQRENSQTVNDTKFFYASDVKTAIQQPKQQASTQDNKAPTFFYANGDQIPLPTSSRGSVIGSVAYSVAGSVVGSAVGLTVEERSQPKFFHASGTPDLLPLHLSTANPIVPSSQFSTPRLATRSTQSPLQRPPSPLKIHHTISSAESKHAVTSPSPVPARTSTPQDSLTCKPRGSETMRRASAHERAASTGALDMGPSIGRACHPAPIAPLSPPLSAKATTTASILTTEDILSESRHDVELLRSDTQSPVRVGHTLERLNELAANARRERKVLDLEITNSSLAAINRTLEREMRKQTAELRRYRRLSRSGRLSINTSSSLRVSSGTLSIMDGIDGTQLSDMSEESANEESEDDSEDDSETESIDDGSLSPGAMAESDARHRERDEKRLQLDLSKHQQLLIDSQNMNQSLKRCLGWTEELINEGKKALAYSIRVSDIELGGRVLAPDDVEDTDDESLPGIGSSTLSNIPQETTSHKHPKAEEDVEGANWVGVNSEAGCANPAMCISSGGLVNS